MHEFKSKTKKEMEIEENNNCNGKLLEEDYSPNEYVNHGRGV